MKSVLVVLLLVSCALAVDWTTYTCSQMGSFSSTSFTCAEWNTFPLASVSCLNANTACGVSVFCGSAILNTNLRTALGATCTVGISSQVGTTNSQYQRP